MNQQTEIYLALLLCSATVSLSLAAYAWGHRRDAPGATPFVLTALAVALWPAAATLEILSSDLNAKLFWANLQYLSIATIPLGWAVTSFQYVTDGQ